MEKVTHELKQLRKLASLLQSAWFHGEWKAETVNEREMEQIMVEQGYWPAIPNPDYIKNMTEYEAELEKDACIEFAKWLAQDWMSIWVKDKWMWEYQLEGSNTEYITEEQLYQIYLNEN